MELGSHGVGSGVGAGGAGAGAGKPSRPASLNDLIDAASAAGAGQGEGGGAGGGEGEGDGSDSGPVVQPSGQQGQPAQQGQSHQTGQPPSGQGEIGLVAALAKAGFDVEGMTDGEVAEMIEDLQRRADSGQGAQGAQSGQGGQSGQNDPSVPNTKPQNPAPPGPPVDPRSQNRVEDSRQPVSAEAEKAAAIAAAKAEVEGKDGKGEGGGEGKEGKSDQPTTSRFKAPPVSEQALRLQSAGVVVKDPKTGLYKAGDAALQKYADELNAYEQNRSEFTRRLVDDPESVVMEIVSGKLKSLEENFEKRVAEAAKAEVERFKAEREAEAKEAEVHGYFNQNRAKLVQVDADGKELTEVVDGEEVPKLTPLGEFYVRVYETLGHIQDNAARMRQALEIAEQAERIHVAEGGPAGAGKSAGAGTNGSTPEKGGDDTSAGHRKRGLLRRSRDAQDTNGQGGAGNGRVTAPAPTHVEPTRRNRLDMWELIKESERTA